MATSSILTFGDLEVIFPFPSAYPEQIAYMTQLKLSLDAGGPCVLEMPSGTGKTVCLLSLIIAYMAQNEKVGPLIYCTRTLPELEQGIAELRNVHKTRLAVSGLDYDKNFLGIALSRKSSLCLHPEISLLPNKNDIDVACRTRTFPWSEERCEFFDHTLLRPRPGVYGLEDMKHFSAANGICPFYLSRRLIRESQVIFGSYAYVIDPQASEIIYKTVPRNAIVIFDEAHNVDDMCCEFLSSWINQKMIDASIISLKKGQEIASKIRETEQDKLQSAFDKLKASLLEADDDIAAPDTLEIFKKNQLMESVIKKAMPQSLLNFHDFIKKAKKMIEFFAAFIQGVEKPDISKEVTEAVQNEGAFLLTPDPNNPDEVVPILDKVTERYTSAQVIAKINEKCDLDAETIQFMPDRFANFLIQHRVPEFDQFNPLIEILNFASYMAVSNEGYTVFVEQTQDGPIIHHACLDASIAFKLANSHFNRIIVTSGTLSPLNIYPLILNFEPVSMSDFTMSFVRRCLLPLIVTKGDAAVPLSSAFKLRSDERVSRNYGELLLDFVKIVPDGVVCFFPSYLYLRQVFTKWSEYGLIEEILKHKLIFIEAQTGEETSIALENYRKAIECGRGAVFLGVARGRISEGIDFADHYGRCVLLFGLPVRNTQSMLVQARAEYIEHKYGMERSDFLVFDAMRAASQCVGRLLRSKKDYGIVVMADRRFARPKSKEQLPHWIKQFINDTRSDTSIDEAIEETKQFLLQMAQPFKFDPSKLEASYARGGK